MSIPFPYRCVHRPGLRKGIYIVALTLSAVFLAACGNSGATGPEAADKGGGGKGGGKKGGGGDVPVMVAKAATRDVPVEVQVIGNVEASTTISVRAQTTGQLTSVYFKEGDFVKEGELLFTIDPRPLQGVLNQAEAQLARDQAMLGQAEANLQKDTVQARDMESRAQRYAQLYEQKIVSRDQTEQYRANADALAQTVAADRAAIESAKAAIGATRAAVENAKVQLGFTSIKSPVSGRTGNLTVKLGNIVTANNQELMTINQVEPINVTFAVPEAQLASVNRFMAVGKLAVRVRPQDEAGSEQTGVLSFVDNTVDVTTGTIRLKATFPNKDHKLWPGQFVRVTLRLTTRRDAIVVPNEAVQTGQNGSFIYVVKEDRTVESRPVTQGARVEDAVVIESGISAGETVVTEGQLRLAPGSRVSVRDGRGGGGRKGGEGGGGEGRGRGEGGGGKQGGSKEGGRGDSPKS